ncbi:MAG TPA: hypothetical protein ENK48_04565 [Gammaproteobacteria bacterium]|nr:hypothetical protein [Gammaproteobacteria bacterium]
MARRQYFEKLAPAGDGTLDFSDGLHGFSLPILFLAVICREIAERDLADSVYCYTNLSFFGKGRAVHFSSFTCGGYFHCSLNQLVANPGKKAVSMPGDARDKGDVRREGLIPAVI